MATKTIAWNTGSGNITIDYNGSGNGTAVISSDANSLYVARSQQITFKTTSGSPQQTVTVTIAQAAKVRIDISTAVVTAASQTYSGSTKTPTPTVTLNGATIPSSGYDVSYSNNINAGIATITVTGKGDYTGTATGTFTIAKASRTLSFADSYMVLNTSSNATKTATPSAGSGDGAIMYSIANTTYATINSSSGEVTSKTSDGSVTVTATIAEGSNYLGATATYTLYVFATTHNYSYSGSAKNVTLPPGSYKLQVWGAQGGSNAADNTYGITAQAGGKGGYSEGVLTVSSATAVKVYIGGQGGSTAAGWNGGGSSTGTSQYSSGGKFGITKMGAGGGASDIRLSDGELLSRMIVAGGGSGGAMCYTEESVTTDYSPSEYEQGSIDGNGNPSASSTRCRSGFININNDNALSMIVTSNYYAAINWYDASYGFLGETGWKNGSGTYSQSGARYVRLVIRNAASSTITPDVALGKATITRTSTTSTTIIGAGHYGGGTNGGYGTSGARASQTAAGNGGSFGQGANQTVTTYKYVSGAGGGGWYGGGSYISDTTTTYVGFSGGGSGWVNTSASSGNRPSGYTGLQLDSGTTYAGNTSFPSTGGGTEMGHSGNGYAKITRLS